MINIIKKEIQTLTKNNKFKEKHKQIRNLKEENLFLRRSL